MSNKVRRVDLWPDDWLGGTAELNDAECGIYIRACALIYSRGGPITRSHLRQICKSRGARFAVALARLIELGKLVALDAERLDQTRCELELDRAQRRVEVAKENARIRWAGEPQTDHETHTNRPRNAHEPTTKLPRDEPALAKINGLDDAAAMLAKRKQEKSLDILDSKGALGCAWAPASAHAREGPAAPHSPEDVEYVGKIVGELLDVMALPPSAGMRTGTIRAPAAYQAAITATKRDTWLNNLATFVGEALDSLDEQMAAWEAIEAARAAGSRDATPPDVRQAVDRLSRLREAGVQYAVAAE